MLLIADSGSTKTEWALAGPSGIITRFTTPGINPALLSAAKLKQCLDEARREMELPEDVGAVRFYGAGCLPELCPGVAHTLSGIFGVTDVEVHSDMLGAARALWGDRPGIAAILGTGSNSCYYDGRQIAANTPPLGYILGDEGSGARLGARLLNGIFKGYLPPDVTANFHAVTGLDKASVIERVYRQPGANTFLASLVPFIAECIDLPCIAEMVTDEFRLFFLRNIIGAYPERLGVGFVGSLAKVFEPQLRSAAEAEGLTIERIIARPLPELVAYHIAQLSNTE